MMFWLGLNLASGLVTSAAIWSRIPTRARLLSLLAFLALMPVSWAIMQAGGGWAVTPVRYISDLPEDGEISGVSLVQDVAIYIMISVEGEPRLFKLPWSNQSASQLQRMMEGGSGDGPIHGKRGKPGSDYPAEFAGTPQPPAPEKQPEAAAPIFNQGN